MATDFRAAQVETSKIIASGGMAGTTIGLAIYSGSIASNRTGGVSDSAMLSKVGTDVFLFVSGTATKTGTSRSNTSLFGGDVVVSGTLWAERMVIEVDEIVDGDLIVTGNLLVEPDANSTAAVVFRDAAGNNLWRLDTTNYSLLRGANATSTSDYVSIGGGNTNEGTGNYATIGGGYFNSAAAYAAVGGGAHNLASGQYAFIGAGIQNTGSATNSVVVGGQDNIVASQGAFLGGGYYNELSGLYASLVGGYLNTGSSNYVTVGGGQLNNATAGHNTIGGGFANKTAGTYATIAGGYGNYTGGQYAVVGGGLYNSGSSAVSTICGGDSNVGTGQYSSIPGGQRNLASGHYSFAAGQENTGSGYGSVSAGRNNTAAGAYSFVMGRNNTASSNYSAVFGSSGSLASAQGALVLGTDLTGSEADTITIGGGIESPGYTTVISGSLFKVDRASNNTRTFTVDMDNSRVGVGLLAPTDGKLHIHEATAGSVTANSSYDSLVIENSDHAGISILIPDANVGAITWGSPSDSTFASVNADYNGGSPQLEMKTWNTNGFITFGVGNLTETLRLTANKEFLHNDTSSPGTDTIFYISGAIGSKGSTTKGSATFGGDVTISGSLYGGSPLSISSDIGLTGSMRFKEETSAPNADANEAVLYALDDGGTTKLFYKDSSNTQVGPIGSGGSLDDAYDTPNGGGVKSAGVGAKIIADGQPVQIKVAAANKIALAITGSVLIGSGANGLLPPLPTDTNFFVSGSVGARGTSIQGTSLFGGDIASSGSITKIDINGATPIILDDPGIILTPDTVVEFGGPSENIFGNGSDLLIGSGKSVLIMSGGSGTSPIPHGVDTNFFVSGSVGSRSTSTLGTAVFGGDVVISGSINLEPGKTINLGNDISIITGDGTDIDIVSSRKIKFDIEDTTASSFNYSVLGTNILLLTSSAGSAILSSSVHNKDIIFHGNDEIEIAKIDATNSAFQIGFDGVSESRKLLFGSTSEYIHGTGAQNVLSLQASRQIFIHSGTAEAAAPNPINMTDTNFYVSGAIDSKDKSNGYGTSVFGGDVVVSGSITAGKETIVQRLYWNGSITDGTYRFPSAGEGVTTTTSPDVEHFWTTMGSGSLKALDIWVSEGSSAKCTIGLFVNDLGLSSCHVTGSFVNNNILGGGNRGHLFIDFKNSVNIANYITGSNTFNPGDIISVGICKTGGSTFSNVMGTLYYEVDTITPHTNQTGGVPS